MQHEYIAAQVGRQMICRHHTANAEHTNASMISRPVENCIRQITHITRIE